LGFPSSATIAVPAGIAEDEELSGMGTAKQALLAPPMCDGVSSEGGSVMGNADHDGASIGEPIIDPVRDGNAVGFLNWPTSSDFLVSTLRIGRPRR
jgi:hypothetical protein